MLGTGSDSGDTGGGYGYGYDYSGGSSGAGYGDFAHSRSVSIVIEMLWCDGENRYFHGYFAHLAHHFKLWTFHLISNTCWHIFITSSKWNDF